MTKNNADSYVLEDEVWDLGDPGLDEPTKMGIYIMQKAMDLVEQVSTPKQGSHYVDILPHGNLRLYPSEDGVPCRFHRLMQQLILGFRWRRVEYD